MPTLQQAIKPTAKPQLTGQQQQMLGGFQQAKIDANGNPVMNYGTFGKDPSIYKDATTARIGQNHGAADWRDYIGTKQENDRKQGILSQGADARMGLMAALQRSGGGGADALRQVGNIQNQETQGIAGLDAMMADKQNDRAWQKYLMDIQQQQAEQERARQDSPLNFLGNVAGIGLGGLAGGLGGALAKKWMTPAATSIG